MVSNEQYEVLKTQFIELQDDYENLKVEVEYLRKKVFGISSEKTSTILSADQLSLFDEAEIETDPNAIEPTLEDTINPTSKKFKGQRAMKLKDLPHKKVIHDLTMTDKFCPACGTELSLVGEEFVRSEVVFKRPQLYIIDHYERTYECRKCRNTDDAIYISSGSPEPVIPHSIASPSSVANVMYQKYVNHMPLYRQENEWKQLGLYLSRQTMSNWIIICANDWLTPIFNKMHKHLVKESYLHADETRLEVMNEEGRKNTSDSFMWLFSSIQESEHPIRLFQYSPTRNGDVAKDFLKGFSGKLITDAYDGYEKVENIIRCNCWAHVRRYYVDSLPTNINNVQNTAPVRGIAYCNKLFAIEKEIANETPEIKKQIRQERSKPIVDEFFEWVHASEDNYLKNSKIGKAITYSLNQQKGLEEFLSDGLINISNNVAENAIRPVTVGRRNWLFSGSPKGATASCMVYSIVETAKANGIDPYLYLEKIFSELPGMAYDEYPEYLEDYMPWSEEVQRECKKLISE